MLWGVLKQSLYEHHDKVMIVEWKGINCKQSTRWQHLSQLKASAFFSLQKKFSCCETQQLILGTGTAIWWVTEPHEMIGRLEQDKIVLKHNLGGKISIK
jgi:hypothetical protein